MIIGISGITSAFWNNNLHLLNSTAKLSGIIHHIYAEYIIFPMATPSIRLERGHISDIYHQQKYTAPNFCHSDWPFCAWIHRIAHYLILGWKWSFSHGYLEYQVMNRNCTSQNRFSTLWLWKWTWKCRAFLLYLIFQGHLFPYLTAWSCFLTQKIKSQHTFNSLTCKQKE